MSTMLRQLCAEAGGWTYFASAPLRIIQGSKEAAMNRKFSRMRQIATVAENHHLRLCAARNLENRTLATLVILVSPMK